MGWRHGVFAFLVHSAFALMFIHRLDLSVAIIPMVVNDTKKSIKNPLKESNTLRVFKWDQAEQGMVLSAFFFGYIPPQIPAGVLVDRYGGMDISCLVHTTS